MPDLNRRFQVTDHITYVIFFRGALNVNLHHRLRQLVASLGHGLWHGRHPLRDFERDGPRSQQAWKPTVFSAYGLLRSQHPGTAAQRTMPIHGGEALLRWLGSKFLSETLPPVQWT